jgi:hypothetical protein
MSQGLAFASAALVATLNVVAVGPALRVRRGAVASALAAE